MHPRPTGQANGSVIDRNDGALSDCTELFFVVFDSVDVAQADCLPLAGTLRVGTCDEERPDGGLHVVDLELGHQDVAIECKSAGERDRIVRKVADHAPVDKPVLLLQMVSDREDDLCISR